VSAKKRSQRSTAHDLVAESGSAFHWLHRPVDVASLVVFRISLGGILIWETGRYLCEGWATELFLGPRFHFTWPGLEWIAPWPGGAMQLHFLALGLCAAAIMVGLAYRLAATLFCIGFAYVALLDRSQYLNHFYLVVLLTCLMFFVPAHRMWSLDAWLRPGLRSEFAPAWSLWILRFQVAVPYVYGGIAKLNADWLAGQPMQLWMARMEHVRAWIPAFGEPWLALMFSYGGLALDLGVVPLLLWRRTRPLGFALAVTFHVMNAVMFHIGIFPWLMIAATTLFFEPDWPRRVLAWFRASAGTSAQSKAPTTGRGESPHTLSTGQGFLHPNALVALLGLYIAVQLLLPLRHWIIPGNVDWTEEGIPFAWRMMLSDKTAAVQFVALDPASGRTEAIDPRQFLVSHQIDRMARDPEMLRQFAGFLKDLYSTAHRKDLEIHVVAYCSLNGRQPQLLVDPAIDLGAQPPRWGHQPWIMPLTEPRRTEPWQIPPNEWPKHLEIPQIKAPTSGRGDSPSGQP
jgi:vitamin K-dependent gamma-carboxylase-like protein